MLSDVAPIYDLEADGFPVGTRFVWPDELGSDCSRLAMYSPTGDGARATVIDLEPLPATSSSRAVIGWAISQLERVRQIHWFGMAYERGGYC